MCVTLSGFLGCPVDSLTVGLIPAIDAYVDYLRRADGVCARCASDSILPSRGRVLDSFVGSGGGVGSRVGGGVDYADANLKILGSLLQGGLCVEGDQRHVGADVVELSCFESRPDCSSPFDRGCFRSGDAVDGSDIVGSQFGGVEGEISSASDGGKPVNAGTARGETGVNVTRSLPRGPNFERNQETRRKKREKKLAARILAKTRVEAESLDQPKGFWNSCTKEDRDLLISSKARMHAAENEFAAAKAQKSLRALNAITDDDQIKCNRVKMQAEVERNMVSIEKTHATLRATGNIPGETGFATTIIGSGTISPDSSASMAEYRKCQKDLLDSEARVIQLVNAMEKAGVAVPHTPASDREHNRALGIWTDTSENMRQIEDMYSDFDVVPGFTFGHEDKVRIIPHSSIPYYQ